jgi:trimethylamine--corrinoid protein Co-methyltransferase
MDVKYLIEMAEAIAGGAEELSKKPIMSTVICPSAPLQLPDTSLAVLWGFASRGLPLVISSGPLLGLGSPVTMAGALAIQGAETLSGIVHAQLVTKGLPVLYGGSALPFDMATANLAHGAIEFSVLSLAEAQMARFHGVPPYGAGGCTNAKTCDAQAGYEKMATTLLSYLAGLDMAVEVSLDNHSLYGPEDLVLQNEVSGIVMRMNRAFEVNEETLAYEVIKKVGIGGNFLAEKHTTTHVKTDLMYPPLSDRDMYEKWLSKGAKELRTRAKERAQQLIEQHKPTPLERDVDKKLDLILEKARKETGT